MSASDRMLETLDAVRQEADGETVPFGDIVERIEERGYGPLIMVLSLFVIGPTGAVPGIPAVVGFALVLLGGQMLLGKSSPWFPGFVRRIEIPCDRIDSTVEILKPWAERLGWIIRQRLEAVCSGRLAGIVQAFSVLVSGLIMIPLGFVPFLPMALGAAMLVLGLGITARDGLAVGAAYVLFLLACFIAVTSTL